MYLGFAATGTVLSGQAINEILHVENRPVGIVVFGVLTLIVATVGYRLIHVLGTIATVVGSRRVHLPRDPAVHGVRRSRAAGRQAASTFPTFLLAVSLGAAWQLTFGPYVADYSRYLPRSTKESHTFWATFLGSVIGSQWSMTLGAIVAAAAGPAFLESQVTFIGDLAGGAAIALLIYLVIVVGKLPSTA